MAKKVSLSYHDIEDALRVFKEQTILPEEVGYNLLKGFGKTDADIRRYKDGKGVLKSPCFRYGLPSIRRIKKSTMISE